MAEHTGKRRDYLTPIGLAIFVLFAFALFFALLRLQHIFQQDLSVRISPNSQSFFIEPGQKAELLIGINASTTPFCTAACSYSLDDISTAQALDNGSFEFSRAHEEVQRYELSVSRIGSGQNLYSFRIECSTKGTLLCSEKETASSALIALNYDLSAAQRILQEQTRAGLQSLLSSINRSDITLQQLNDKAFILSSQINLQELLPAKNEINERFTRLHVAAEELKVRWYEQDYPELPALIANYTAQQAELADKLNEVDAAVAEHLGRHNEKVVRFNNLVRQPWQEFAAIKSIANETDYFSIFIAAREFLRNASAEMQHTGFQDYDTIDAGLNQSSNLIDGLQDTTSRNFNRLHAQGMYLLDVEYAVLCTAKGACRERIPLANLTVDQPFNSDVLRNVCADIKVLQQLYEQENHKAAQVNISGYPTEYPNATLQAFFNATRDALYYNITFFDAALASINDSNNSSYSAAAIKAIIPFQAAEFPSSNMSPDTTFAALPMHFSGQLQSFNASYCRGLNVSRVPELPPLDTVIFSTNFTPVQSINTTLYDAPPRCCIFGVCKPCCSGIECSQNPELYPIILLHGHAFNKENTAAYSLDAFNKIQSKLEQQGYLPAGVVTPLSKYTEFRQGEWGLSGRPVVVKGSYYFTSYYTVGQNVVISQKSENIETYAIRLKEIVDLVKYRTGKDKVIIIAHSMGGLVARSYMQIFGDDSVYKLVMIAAPNHGIEGSLNSYCPLLGERKECEDMAAGSIFMRRLEAGEVPDAHFYTISGTGCVAGNEPGDGITSLQASQLPYAKNYAVEGSCSSFFGTDLHTDILNIDKYNRTMYYLEIILRETPR
ncbi:alpha/beta fold hydrolase [Candidatus Woesearchaeota archaeon]|nr:alpha/beta fold hydrolase [Candidatus Woesearchaeota archaeon]